MEIMTFILDLFTGLVRLIFPQEDGDIPLKPEEVVLFFF